MNTPSLEARHYVATVQDIERLTRDHDAASNTAGSTGGTYLRALIATVQSELGSEPRERTARGGAEGKTAPEECARQLAAFEDVNKRFYAVVLRGLTGDALERNIKSTFARSNASALRRWIRSGHDVTRLAARTVTRDALEGGIPSDSKRPARLRVKGLRKRAEKGVAVLTGAAQALDKAERGSGVALLQEAMAAITAQLVKLGGVAVGRNAEAGVREGKPFKKGSAVFWPVSDTAS